VDRGVLRGQRGGSPTVVNLSFLEFTKHHMKILLDFSAKLGEEEIFMSTTGNENLHEIGNDNGVRVVAFAISKNLTVKIQCSHISTNKNKLRGP
jgi:hypothetical protein